MRRLSFLTSLAPETGFRGVSRILIFHSAYCVDVIEHECSREAWSRARKRVRLLAAVDGDQWGAGWYCTCNRAGYRSGDYRATSAVANRGRQAPNGLVSREAYLP